MDVRDLQVCSSGGPEKPPQSLPELLSRSQVWEEGRIPSLQEERSQGQLQADRDHPFRGTKDSASTDWKGQDQGEEEELFQWKDSLSNSATKG